MIQHSPTDEGPPLNEFDADEWAEVGRKIGIPTKQIEADIAEFFELKRLRQMQ
jgi:hypothetical protein